MKSTIVREQISHDIATRHACTTFLETVCRDRDSRHDAVYWLKQERELIRDVERRRVFLKGLQADFGHQHSLPFAAQPVAPSLDYPAPILTGRQLRLEQINDTLTVLEQQHPGWLWIAAIVIASAIAAVVIAANVLLVVQRADGLLP